MKHFYQSVTTDIVIFTIEDDHLKVLLIKRANAPFKDQWALPGGFLFEKEDPDKAASRVLLDKAGIKDVYPDTKRESATKSQKSNNSRSGVGVYLEQLYTFGGSGRDPRGKIITISYFALAPKDKIKIITSPKIQTPTFRSVKKLPDIAFDHNRIITYALQRLQSKLEYTNVIYSLLPKYFTFNQLQRTYEIILNKKLDKRNFRKKFMLLGLIKATNKTLKGERQRPAKLYIFKSRKPAELKKFF